MHGIAEPLAACADEQVSFVVYFDGQLRRGFSREQVERQLRQRLRLPGEIVAKFFAGKVKLRSGLDRDKALALKKQFYAAGALLEIEAEMPAESDEVLSLAQIQAAFGEPMPTLKTSLAYRTRLALVAFLTLLMPLVYLGLVAAIPAGLFSYYDYFQHDLNNGNMQTRAKFLGLVVPALLGTILLLFLLKPLLARRVRSPRQTLNPVQHRRFFELVACLCRHIGVPQPVRIIVDNDVNASASLHRGALGLLSGRLELTIGLPLLAGLNSRQLVGVLAHEFGHFSQRSGMSVYYLINTVNSWLYSRAYEPDTWDLWVHSWAHRVLGDSLLRFIELVLQLTRWLMRGLFLVSYRCSQSLSRQMEFDADRYEARVAGSAAFADTAFALNALVDAEREVEQINERLWRDQDELLENRPAAIAAIAAGYDDRTMVTCNAVTKDCKTHPWDSHPADGERIASALEESAPGVFRYEQPASTLLPDLEQLCKTLTLRGYRDAGFDEPETAVTTFSDFAPLRSAPLSAS